MRTRILCPLIVVGCLVSCGVVPRRVSAGDPEVQPLLQALDMSNRLALGFTPLAPGDELRLEGRGRNYDAMLHVRGRTSRTIAFARRDGSWVWVGEQEIYTGPCAYETVDGRLREEIVLTYETRPISGVDLSRLVVDYHGDDPDLSWPRILTLSDVGAVLAHWRSEGTHCTRARGDG